MEKDETKTNSPRKRTAEYRWAERGFANDGRCIGDGMVLKRKTFSVVHNVGSYPEGVLSERSLNRFGSI